MDYRPSAALIDSEPGRRIALSRLLSAAGLELVVEKAIGIEAVETVRRAAPDLVFIAFEEPLPRAIHAVEELSACAPGAVVVGFADEADTNAFRRAIEAGAKYLIDTPASEAEMRAILQALGPREPRPVRETGTVAVIAGQKGGIGKTTVSVNLASTLARDNRGSVLLVDLDPDFGDAGILLDLNTNLSMARAAREQAQFEFESFKRGLSVHESGAYLLGAPQSFAERLGASPDDLEALIRFASRAFDYVLIDTPCVLNDTVMAALSVADVTLVTTTLEFSSLRNTSYLFRELLEAGVSPERAVLVANHIDPVASFSPGDAAEILEREAIWEVPYDRAMPRSTQLGVPLTTSRPKSAASKSLRALAYRLGEDPARIDRRLAVRGTPSAPAEVRERLISLVRPKPAGPLFAFGAGKRSTTYHQEGCKVERRLAERRMAVLEELPRGLRPCRVCLGDATAAA